MKTKTSSRKTQKLVDALAELGYEVRFVKGQFQSGHCILRDQKIILVNRYFDEEGKNIILQNLLTELSFSSQNV